MKKFLNLGFLVNRGIKTLACRMKQHMENGFKIARYLSENKRILKVIYPGRRVLFIYITVILVIF